MPGNKKKYKLISVIIPSYNEEGNVEKIAQYVTERLFATGYEFELIFVDDGSTDQTLLRLEHLHKNDTHIKYLSLSRNFGHQSALKAGLDFAKGDAVISMDADLQHPPELIKKMLQYWEDGYDVVYTQRKEDPSLPYFKRATSRLFYRLLNLFSDIKLEPGTSDFRLLDKKVVSVIREMPEDNLFFRGLVKWVGFKQHRLEYMPDLRYDGSSKYSLRNMFSLAISGVTSTSIFPLRIASLLGFIVSIGAFGYSLVVIYDYFFTSKNLPGWTTIILAVLFLGGVQLISIGIIGEYLGKLLIQSKGRPKYIIKQTHQDAKEENPA